MVEGDFPTPRSPALAALHERGFIEQTSDAAALDAALARGSVTFYNGFDPTGRSLHAGHLVTIMAMRLLQKHGHRPIVLLGGGTARVGDPSERTETRRMLDEPAIDENVRSIGRQFGRFLTLDPDAQNGARVLDNAAWLSSWRYIDFLREIGSHFTVNRMIATKTYRDRLDSELPLSFLEFNYQLLQAYDFLHLYREQGCTLQTGGGDQWGNMIAGVELIRRIAPRELTQAQGPAQCLTFPLLLTADGRKMGKTERGAVWLDPELLSPFDYYQYWIGVDDRDVNKLLRLFTDLEIAEIDALCRESGAALRAAKARLAFEATRLAHGEAEAHAARVAAEQAFGTSDDWSAVPAVHLPGAAWKLVDLVTDERIRAFKSKREARQRIEGGAVRIDGNAIVDPETVVHTGELRLQAGKKLRLRVVLEG